MLAARSHARLYRVQNELIAVDIQLETCSCTQFDHLLLVYLNVGATSYQIKTVHLFCMAVALQVTLYIMGIR